MKPKRILITGGAGFLGSHLCRKAVKEGHKVYCLDNLFTGSVNRIADILDEPNLRFIQHDVAEPLELEVDLIYNLACPASPIHYQHDPIKTMTTSIYGAINMLNLAKKYNAKIFQASTSEIYGDPLTHPQPESYWGNVNTIGVRSCYDEGKRAAETLFFDYHRKYDFPIKVARIFNTYGPAMDVNDGRVVSNFIVQSLRGEPISVYGDGSQTRSFCYVDDLIDAFWLMMEATENNITGPINLGNPTEFTVGELAKLIINLTGSKSDILYHPLPSDDPKQRKPDISQAKQKLNWTPQVKLETGLIKTIEYFERILSKSNSKVTRSTSTNEELDLA